ncbi:MAG: winged helix-turn-helix transcriptional regulator [Spirochaetes bacterium]|nr:winged helix-turn-helix transcriptional regulator [Spirochaetota bacterium]
MRKIDNLNEFLKKLKEPEEYPGFLLWQASNIWQRLIKNNIKQFNTTYTQFIILTSIIYLSQYNKQINQKQIAQQAKLDIMTTSDVIKTLEAKKLLVRSPYPDDKRYNSLKVTKKGTELVFNIFYHVRISDITFFRALGKKEGKIFRDLLLKLIKGNYDKIFNSDQ